MPQLQASPESAAAAIYRSQVRAAHAAAVACANKVAAREPNLITAFALSAELDEIEDLSASAIRCGEVEIGVALRTAARRLRVLIPA